jgi:hypothetical protein
VAGMAEQKKKRSGLWFSLIVVVLVVALALEGFVVFVVPKGVSPWDYLKQKDAKSAGKSDPISYFGDKAAPIKIEFYAPLVLEWHRKTIGLLRDYDTKHPKQISVKLMPMGNAECDKEMVSRGFTCAVIFINGQHEFTLPNGKKVDLQKKPNTTDSFYNSEDVITILDSMKQAPKK